MTPSQGLNQSKVEAFGQSMASALNGAAIALMASIGHQTGLFDTMARLPPSTSHQIATAAKLQERYVREWLASLVAGQVIDYDPVQGTYTLPPEHALLLTRAAGPNNIASGAQIVALLAEVEQGIVASFRNGGGVPYAHFPRFQQMMAELSDAGHMALIDTKLPLVPGLVARLQVGIDVADIGCGCGRAINLMAHAFPNSRFVGYDFSEEAIAIARAEATQMGLTNASFEVKDVAILGVVNQFDFVTAFGTIHDLAHPSDVLRGIAIGLRAGGIFLMAEAAASSKLEENLDRMMSPWDYAISCMHCITVSLALDGEGLGLMWGAQKARTMLADAGFTHIEIKQLETNQDTNYFIATKD
jgi:2-polyprenyl-3-methyl-5-hydroxy-6-metoxy-1,4-benzoquinol methylase